MKSVLVIGYILAYPFLTEAIVTAITAPLAAVAASTEISGLLWSL